MKISEVCIQRPILAWVMTIILILLGLVGGSRLALRYFPKMESPYVTIETTLPGAGPELVETQITRVIEEAVAGLEGVVTVTSKSSVEESKVYLEFAQGLKYDPSVEILNRLNKFDDKLPEDATDCILTKARSDDAPIMTLALTSESVEPSELADFATREIQKDIESLQGVARVDVIGAGHYTMHIFLDPVKIAAHNISVAEIKTALKRQNVEKPAGKLVSDDREFWVTTVASLETVDEFNQMVVATKNGHMIRLIDIGRAEVNAEDNRTRTRYNGKKGISLGIVAQSTANPIEVSRLVKQVLPTIRERIPEGSEIEVGYDSTKFIERSLVELRTTIFEAAFLVIMVVLLFLRSARASLIPIVTIPVSLIGAFFAMYLFGFTINKFTLMAMVLAIGLVVDDAIIVLENIYRHIEEGLKPLTATIKGIREISFAVVATTLTLVAVYLPVALSTGRTGKLFTEFAVTLASAVLLSGFAALTLSPMMCARLLRAHGKKTPSERAHPRLTHFWDQIKSYVPTDEWLSWIEKRYDQLVRQTLDMKWHTLLAGVCVAIVGAIVFFWMPQELYPKEDQGYIKIEGQAPASSTLIYTDRYVQMIDEAIKDYPEIERRMTNITNPTYEVRINLWDKRSRSTDEVVLDMQEKLTHVIGVDVRVSASGGSGAGEATKLVQFVIMGNKTHRELKDLAEQMKEELFRSGIAKGIRAELRNSDAEDFILIVNRNKISVLGIEAATIAETVEALIRGQKATSFKRENKLYDVKVEVEDKSRKTPHDITNLFVRANDKEQTLVPLSELVTVESRASPLEINHYNRVRSIAFSLELADGTSFDTGIARVKAIGKDTLPRDVRVEFVDDTRQFLEESNNVVWIFLLALAFIFLILAAQFESWIDPFIIILTVPLSLTGALLVLRFVDGGSINLYSQIGFVTLIGLITKHGIMMVDFANKLRDDGMSIHDSIVEASRLRLRPILMTTFAMVLGSVPLALGSGAGSETLRQIGWVIVGGMSLGTIFTLFILPSVYMVLTRRHRAPVISGAGA